MLRTMFLAAAAAALIGAAPALAQQPAAKNSRLAATTSAPTTPRQMASDRFASEAEAKAHCGTGMVVWVNTRSHVYHFPGTPQFGHTKHGAFMCKADADKTGTLRAAKGEAPNTGSSTIR